MMSLSMGHVLNSRSSQVAAGLTVRAKMSNTCKRLAKDVDKDRREQILKGGTIDISRTIKYYRLHKSEREDRVDPALVERFCHLHCER